MSAEVDAESVRPIVAATNSDTRVFIKHLSFDGFLIRTVPSCSAILRGTIGQPDAGDLAGGGFVLRGGFWQPVAAEEGCGPQLALAPSVQAHATNGLRV